MRQGAVTSPSTYPPPQFDEGTLRGERTRFLLLLGVVLAVVLTRWVTS
jgi:hypothetical protein